MVEKCSFELVTACYVVSLFAVFVALQPAVVNYYSATFKNAPQGLCANVVPPAAVSLSLSFLIVTAAYLLPAVLYDFIHEKKKGGETE